MIHNKRNEILTKLCELVRLDNENNKFIDLIILSNEELLKKFKLSKDLSNVDIFTKEKLIKNLNIDTLFPIHINGIIIDCSEAELV